MRLVIDVGNTSITSGAWKGQKLLWCKYFPTKDFLKFKINPQQFSEIIYASVVPKVDSFFRNYFRRQKFIALNYKNIPGLKIALPNKKEIGIDRLVNARGAMELYGTPAIIIDFGTATTFCVVDQNNVYQGGLICPGINLTRTVLHEKTAKLPLIKLESKPKELIGKSTLTAMQSGIFYGYQSLVEGIIQKLRADLGGNYKVIATGGYAHLICKNLKTKAKIVDQNLTLKSLNLIGNLLVDAQCN